MENVSRATKIQDVINTVMVEAMEEYRNYIEYLGTKYNFKVTSIEPRYCTGPQATTGIEFPIWFDASIEYNMDSIKYFDHVEEIRGFTNVVLRKGCFVVNVPVLDYIRNAQPFMDANMNTDYEEVENDVKCFWNDIEKATYILDNAEDYDTDLDDIKQHFDNIGIKFNLKPCFNDVTLDNGELVRVFNNHGGNHLYQYDMYCHIEVRDKSKFSGKSKFKIDNVFNVNYDALHKEIKKYYGATSIYDLTA